MVFLYSSNEHTKNKIRKIAFKVAQNRVKHIGIYLTEA